MVVGCVAKLEHRIQVQKSMIKFLGEKVQQSISQSGIPWVTRNLDAEETKGLNKIVETLQNDSCHLSEVLYHLITC